MKEKLPINTEVLKWARTSISLSISDIAQKMAKDVKVIEAWEAGTESPTYPQLERLAHDIYKRPVAIFFFPSVPKEDSPKTEFRTLPNILIDELPPEIIKLYRKAKIFQFYLDELYGGAKPVETSLLDKFELERGSGLSLFINEIRKELGISFHEQSKWRSTELAFKKWREALEKQGIFVFKDAFRNDEYSGFCLYSDKYPIIFVNNSMPSSRQLFTLFHELGHLLFQLGGIDFRSRKYFAMYKGYYSEIEILCNRFANEFLVPQLELNSFTPEISESHFRSMADYFSVSREVILRNYLDRGIVDETLYEEMTEKWRNQAEKRRNEKDSSGSFLLIFGYMS